MNYVSRFTDFIGQLYYGDRAKWANEVSAQCNEKLATGTARYVYGDQPVTECISGGKINGTNIASLLFKTKAHFHAGPRDVTSYESRDSADLPDDATQHAKALSRFNVKEVTETEFSMAQWIHERWQNVQVNTTGINIDCGTVGYPYKSEWKETGADWESFNLEFQGDNKVIVDVTGMLVGEEYRRFTCLNPQYSFNGNRVEMSCSNLESPVSFVRKPYREVAVNEQNFIKNRLI